MPVDSESTAKAFVVDKVIQQAEREGVPLSKAQRYMLSWSETDPSFVVDMELSKQCEDEIPQPDYEKKIKGLIERMYKRDIETNKDLEKTYKEAYKTLKQGDHFISIMIGDAIGLKLSWFRLF